MALLPTGPAQSQAKAVEEKIRIVKLKLNAIVINLVKCIKFIVVIRSDITIELSEAEHNDLSDKSRLMKEAESAFAPMICWAAVLD